MNNNQNNANTYNKKTMCCAECGKQSTAIVYDDKYKMIQSQKHPTLTLSDIQSKYREYQIKYVSKKWMSDLLCRACWDA